MLIGSFYRSPDNDDIKYLECLRESVSKIDVNKHTTICLGGDFNLGDILWESNTLKHGYKKTTLLSRQLLDIADEFVYTNL